MIKKESPELLGVGLLKKDLRAEIEHFIIEAGERFIQLHGGRDVGKTYTTQKTVVRDCLANHEEFVLAVPTIKQQEKGALRKWLSKMLRQQFPDWQKRYTTEYFYMRRDEEDDWQRVGQCVALSNADFDKMDSDKDLVRYMIWDEAMRAELKIGAAEGLIEKFLIAYHTFDRDEDRIKAIFLGNALNKMDPLYNFFNVNITKLKHPGTVIRSFNKASWYVPVPPDIKDNEDNKFRQMVKGTRYGDMADGAFDLSYGYLIGDPGDAPVSSVIAIECTSDSYMMIMMSERCLYFEECTQDFARQYASQIYASIFKEATPEKPMITMTIINMIRSALAAGRCKFVDEESLLICASRLKILFNISIL